VSPPLAVGALASGIISSPYRRSAIKRTLQARRSASVFLMRRAYSRKAAALSSFACAVPT